METAVNIAVPMILTIAIFGIGLAPSIALLLGFNRIDRDNR